MNISVLTVFPELYTSFLSTSLVKRACDRGVVTCDVQALSSFVPSKERIDAPIYGHGVGMLLKPTVIEKAVDAQEVCHGKALKIFFSPQGKKLTQPLLHDLAERIKKTNHLMLLPARYEGMDSRVEEHYADEIVSVGDFVLMGGDLPAMMLIEGLLRLIPSVIGKQESVHLDSFSGPFVDFPTYTEPVEWKGCQVPDVVRSGNHQAVDAWRREHAVSNTVYNHFEWLRSHVKTSEDKKDAYHAMPKHYAVLMHTDVLIGSERKEGTTSVTSLDIHDIARSAKTYGIDHYYIVTPLQDQQKIVKKFLSFWHEGPGRPYNPNRYEAVKHVSVVSSFQEVCDDIKARNEQKDPLIITTSACESEHKKTITFYDQNEVWRHKAPVALVFGTGRGLSDSFVAKADYLLIPVEGFTNFNHLSVRSAAAIIFDRWLGINRRL